MTAARVVLGRASIGIRRRISGDGLAALTALAALAVWIAPSPFPATVQADVQTEEQSTAANPAESTGTERAARTEHKFGGYGGVSYTHPSAVRIANPDAATDFTVTDFGWIGRPFKSPIYYGLRTQHWAPGALTGAMVDFTHAKAIAERDDVATFTGTHNGQPVSPKAKIGDVFRHLEFSHGHNILTLNGVFRMPGSWLPVRPYFGLGGGASLPHTEVGLVAEGKRTYEYQFAGFAGQLLAGIEVPLGRVSLFFEYKFTYAPYGVPLSHEPYGWVFFTDVWRQLRAWWTGEKPPGGVLTTTLATHHGISGVLVRVNSTTPAKM